VQIIYSHKESKRARVVLLCIYFLTCPPMISGKGMSNCQLGEGYEFITHLNKDSISTFSTLWISFNEDKTAQTSRPEENLLYLEMLSVQLRTILKSNNRLIFIKIILNRHWLEMGQDVIPLQLFCYFFSHTIVAAAWI
jgi:hypothetical protein